MRGVLFLCTGNSCRSQMAEWFARALAPPGIAVWSAGTAPAGLHPGAVASMAEAGIDISRQRSKSLGEVPADRIDLVVTLCGEAAEACPTWPRRVERLHWPLPDPAKARGSREEIAAVFERVRDEIGRRVRDLFAAASMPRAPAPEEGSRQAERDRP